MTADFPENVVNLPNKSDGEKLYGVEYNKIVDEITAIETELKKPAAETIVQAADSAKLDGNDSAYFMPASYADGWIPVSATWTYASATTITVPSGAAAIYSVGDKLKLTQTTVKYFYIVGVADTVLTITGGSDYTLDNAAISAISYSKAATPLGFPFGSSVYIPLTDPLTSTSFAGTSFSTTPRTLLDLSTVFGLPSSAKALVLYVAIRDSASATNDAYVGIGPSSSSSLALIASCAGRPNDVYDRTTSVVPCGANGNIYYEVYATGSLTADVTIRIWGYWL